MNTLHKLCLYPKFTLSKYHALKRQFGDIQKAWQAEFSELTQAGFDENSAHEFLEWRDAFTEKKYTEVLNKDGIQIISIEDAAYPSLLKDIFDPPVALFVRGTLDNSRPRFAIVGTRKMTIYGHQVTEEITGELARHGIEIVSGLALGIDGTVHKATLEANGSTTAVLGSGIDRRSIYPRAHYELSERIIDKGGALIGEYPPGTEPTTYSFPKRNRIIAGISLATLVIEADEKSGALITAQCALEYGRDVYAVPHALTSPTGAGPHKLIRDGAYLVRNAEDILENLNITEFERTVRIQETIPDTLDEAKIVELLSREPIHVDELARRSTFPQPKVIAMLTVLEMKGRIKNVGNMMYIIKK